MTVREFTSVRNDPITVEMTPYEAELLIGLLVCAEALQPWRSALLQAYDRERLVSAPAVHKPSTRAGCGDDR